MDKSSKLIPTNFDKNSVVCIAASHSSAWLTSYNNKSFCSNQEMLCQVSLKVFPPYISTVTVSLAHFFLLDSCKKAYSEDITSKHDRLTSFDTFLATLKQETSCHLEDVLCISQI